MGKTILIAGGTDGIGRALVDKCLHTYDKIYVLGRHNRDLSNEIEYLCDDITVRTAHGSVEKLIDDSISEFVLTIGTFVKGDREYDESLQHFELNCVANAALIKRIMPKLTADAQILVMTASLCANWGRPEYPLQGATKVALQYYVDSLREQLRVACPKMRVMTIQPAGVQTDIFAKGGDERNTSKYPTPDKIADIMLFQLSLPRDISIDNIVVRNV